MEEKQTEFEALCPSCNKHFVYPVEGMSDTLLDIYKYQGFIVTVCDDCK